jgi:hypothetical protein
MPWRTFWQVQGKIEHGMLSNRSLVKLAVSSSVLSTATPIMAYITRTPFQFLRIPSLNRHGSSQQDIILHLPVGDRKQYEILPPYYYH